MSKSVRFCACFAPKREYDGRTGVTQSEEPTTGTEWAHREQLEMLRLGTPRIVDEHDPEGFES